MLEDRLIDMPKVAIINSSNVIEKMGELSERNFMKTIKLLDKFDKKRMEKIEERENAINRMEESVTGFLVKLASMDLSSEESININSLLKIESEFEKIGDYAYDFSKIVESIYEKDIKISDTGNKDLQLIFNVTEDTILSTIKVFKEKKLELVIEIEALKEFAEIQKEKYKMDHIQRLKEGKCSVEGGISFLEILSMCEKIIDHCSNVSIATMNNVTNEIFITKQDFFKKLYEKESELLKNKLNECNHKYAI